MGVQIKDLNEELAPDTGDRFLVQRASNNKVVSVTNSNILPADSINHAKLTNADTSLTVDDTNTDRVWWRELRRSTRTTSTDTITCTISGSTKYMKVFISLLPTGGTINQTVRFDLGAAGSVFAGRASDNGGADSTATSATSFNFSTGTAATPQFTVMDMWFQPGVQTLVTARIIGQSTAGKTTAPLRKEYTGKYVYNVAEVAVIEVINSGTGSYDVGSEIVVLGHD